MKNLKFLLIATCILAFAACTNNAEKNSGAEINTDTFDTTSQDSMGTADTASTDTTSMPSSGIQ